jgi:hypothetical protein
VATDPVVGADAGGGGAGAEREVEGVDGQAVAVQTHHVGPTRRPVLHVAQVRPVLQHRVAAAEDRGQRSKVVREPQVGKEKGRVSRAAALK